MLLLAAIYFLEDGGGCQPFNQALLKKWFWAVVRAETGFVKEQYKLILRWERRYTAGHDPETSKTIYKNVLGRTQEEAKEKYEHLERLSQLYAVDKKD